MFMPKKPLSVTLDETNLLWLRGRVAGRKKRSLSDALDEVLTAARRGGHGADKPRSVAGTIDIAEDDLDLERADEMLRAIFDASARQPVIAKERLSPPASRRPAAARKARRG
jgi:hypothetical protein